MQLPLSVTHGRPSKSYDAYFDVLQVLLVRWLLNQGVEPLADAAAGE